MKIGFIGTGHMGSAILKGYAKSQTAAGNEILLHNRTTERNAAMVEAVAAMKSKKDAVVIRVCNDNRQLAEESDVILIGVRPTDVPAILKEISPEVKNVAESPGKDKIIVSMAAGVSLSVMKTALLKAGAEAKLIRVMPNIPATVGEGMTSISRNYSVSDSDLAKVKAIFDSIGRCEEVPENMIDCVIGVSGSSPAYTYMYIDALAQAAVDNGMDPEKARIFAAQSVLGAAKQVLESEESLEQLRLSVCLEGGTTIEAVNKLLTNGFMNNVKEGFQAAVDRSKEMTKI